MLSIQQVEGRMYFSNIKHYVRPNVIGIHTFAYIIKHNARTQPLCAMITFTACSKNAVYRSLFSSSCWINITFSSVWQLGEMCHCLELICCEIRLRENDVHMKCILYIWLYDIHHTLDRDPSTSISSVKLAAENHLILSVSSRTVPHGACAPQAGDPAAAVRAK